MNETKKFALTQDEFEGLLVLLGTAVGSLHQQKAPAEMIRRSIRIVNRIGTQGSPDRFRTYDETVPMDEQAQANIIVLDDLLDEIETFADRIYLREQVDGKWGPFALSELPAARAVHHAFNFIRRGQWPVRLKTDDEIAAGKKIQ